MLQYEFTPAPSEVQTPVRLHYIQEKVIQTLFSCYPHDCNSPCLPRPLCRIQPGPDWHSARIDIHFPAVTTLNPITFVPFLLASDWPTYQECIATNVAPMFLSKARGIRGQHSLETLHVGDHSYLGERASHDNGYSHYIKYGIMLGRKDMGWNILDHTRWYQCGVRVGNYKVQTTCL